MRSNEELIDSHGMQSKEISSKDNVMRQISRSKSRGNASFLPNLGGASEKSPLPFRENS